MEKSQNSVDEEKPSQGRLTEWITEEEEENNTSDGGRAEGSASPLMPLAQVNPYGCKGKTHYSHKSSETGRANVHAKTDCPSNTPMPTIGAYILLYKAECNWAGVCTWVAHGDLGFTENSNDYQAWATSNGVCESGQYKGDSAHWIIDHYGDLYGRITDEQNYVNCG